MLRQWLTGEPSIQIIEIKPVWNTVIDVINEAQDELVLVSPYNEYSVPLKEALKKAAERRVRVTAVCRQEQKGKEDAHFEWLRDIGADVLLVSRLHAKIYYNESTAVVTSMNLLKSSATDSKEIGFIINDTDLRDQIREYVQRDLIAHSQLLAPRRKPAPPRRSAPKAAAASDTGHCIHCGVGIALNPERPFCPKCFRSWDKNPNSPEKHCHLCGNKRKTSFARPLCRTCWGSVVQA